MKYNPDIHHRRSLRLKGYDYSGPGAYFVTICVKNRECLFGEVSKGEMRLNEKGQMVQMVWDELPKYYQGVAIDAFQIMPNHVHGIIILNHPIPRVGAGPRACPSLGQPQGVAPTRQPQEVAPTMSFPDVVHRFKSLTTTRYRQIVKNYGWPLFHGRQLWQRNYYEHVIRNDVELNRSRGYIQNNPFQWHLDRENPERIGPAPLEEEIFGKENKRFEKARSV